MLDLARIQRIKLSRYPLTQRVIGQLLTINYGVLPGVRIDLEHAERLPEKPVLFAMNHTDRFNYFPFQYTIWKRFNRFTATWVKGKYYENFLMAQFMERTNQLPTISRGYLITKDFTETIGRKPSDAEYELLRRWVDAAADGGGEEVRPDLEKLPEILTTKPRNVLGHGFDPHKEDYAGYVNSLFRIMMRSFIELNERVAPIGLDMLIFPQGTRSLRLLPGKIGISQIALHLKSTIVPIGCNGCDGAYPSGNPWAKKAHIVYRFGEPIEYEELSAFHTDEPFEPFSPAAETRYQDRFQGLADLVTERIDGLLDERHRESPEAGVDSTKGADRFI